MRVYLREWREYLGLTQEQIADRIETTKGTVSRMEINSREPNLGYLAAFAEAIDREVSELFRDPERPTQEDLLRSASPEQAREIADFAAFVRQRDGSRG